MFYNISRNFLKENYITYNKILSTKLFEFFKFL